MRYNTCCGVNNQLNRTDINGKGPALGGLICGISSSLIVGYNTIQILQADAELEQEYKQKMKELDEQEGKSCSLNSNNMNTENEKDKLTRQYQLEKTRLIAQYLLPSPTQLTIDTAICLAAYLLTPY